VMILARTKACRRVGWETSGARQGNAAVEPTINTARATNLTGGGRG